MMESRKKDRLKLIVLLCLAFVSMTTADADAESISGSRVKRSEDDFYDYDYDYYDYDDYLYPDKTKDEPSLLERLNTKYKHHVIGAVILANIAFCCCCAFCKFCKLYCEDRCCGWTDCILTKVDQLRGRSPDYRSHCKMMKNIGIEPPTYKQYCDMLKAYGIHLHMNVV